LQLAGELPERVNLQGGLKSLSYVDHRGLTI